jgi:puromycin-sensitive aminopeptidase
VGLRQQRFVYDHLLDDQPDSTIWHVPVSIRGQSAEKASMLMEDSSASVSLAGGADGWLKVNAGQTGFFRSKYGEPEWDRLREAVARKELDPVDRLGLQNDAYALMRAGQLPATVFLSLAGAYAEENDAPVWGDLSSNLKGLESLLTVAPYLDRYRRFAGSLFDGIVAKVGWQAKPGERHLDSILRSTVLGQHGAYGNKATVAEAQRRFKAYLTDPAKLHPDLRAVVFGLSAQAGDRTTYDTLWQLEKQATLAEEKVRILGAMTRFEDVKLLRDLLTRSLGSEVRAQDSPLVIVGVAGNKNGRDLA